jgi:hypothetical protein
MVTSRLAATASEMKIFDPQAQPDPFSRVPEIAARLGVKPVPEGETGHYSLAMRDGTRFDLFELIAAFLDRMDEAHVGFGPRSEDTRP